MRITVVVPAYNEEKLLRRCLDSLVQQEPPPDEIVIVDNASTDSTPDIIKQFIADHPELKVVSVYETKKGCPAARDAGWRAASGDIIVHIDADSVVPPGWMAKIHTALAEDPTVGAIGGTIRHENAPFSIALIQYLLDLVYPRLLRLIKGFPYIWGAMTICRREVLEKMDGYANRPPGQLEDYYLSEQAHKLGYKLRYMPSIYAIHSSRRYESGGLRAWVKWQMAGVDAKQYPDDIR
jgi:glycosyltransferase involved in cell wall biosynthesis